MSVPMRKIWRDLLTSKGKSFIVILSVFTGIVGTGVIGHTGHILENGMKDSLETFQPPSGTIHFQQFDDHLLKQVNEIEGVRSAEARTSFDSEIYLADEKKWKKIKLFVIEKDDPNVLDKMLYEKDRVPGKGEIFLERLSFDFLQVKQEDEVKVKSSKDQETNLLITGSVHQGGLEATPISSVSYGYISKETASDLGFSIEKNFLLYKTDTKEKELNEEIESKIRDLASQEGVHYISSSIHNNKHWGYDIVMSMENILISLGFLTLLLSTCLIINTILSIIKNQIPQIGIMKVIGASGSQLHWLYLNYIIAYSLVALIIGIPVSLYLAKWLSSYSYELLSFTTTELTFSKNTLFTQIAIGLGLPMLSGLIPVMNGVKIRIIDAFNHGNQQKYNKIPVWLLNIPWLSRPFLFVIRDTLQRKFRLLLTIVTLSVGGAIVLSVCTVYQSLMHTVQESLKYNQYDVQMIVNVTNSLKELEETTYIDQVEDVEIWELASGSFVNGNIRSGFLSLIKPPISSTFMEPKIIDGRWLEDSPKNEIVLDSFLSKSYPAIKVGDILTIEMNGEQIDYKVVGKFKKISGEVHQYVNHIGSNSVSSFIVNIKSQDHSENQQSELKEQVTTLYKNNSISTIASRTYTEIKEMQEARVHIVSVFLIGMAMILVVVATMGLVGTLNLNVSERSKSIAIMKLIGGGDTTLWRMVMVESLLIGMVCFFIGMILAYPFSKILCNKVGHSLFLSDLDFSFSILGIVIWFVMSFILSLLASFIPAYKATRVSINKLLSFE